MLGRLIIWLAGLLILGAEPWGIQKISLEDIKSRFSDREIIDIRFIDGHALVESRYSGTSSYYDLIDMENGESSHLDTFLCYVTLIKNEGIENFLFFSNGTNHINAEKEFPFFIECRRNPDGKDEFTRYESVKKLKYYPIQESFEFRALGRCGLVEVIATLEGVEILFGPSPDEKPGGSGAFIMLPATKTSYDKEKNRFIILFENVLVNDEYKRDSDAVKLESRLFRSVDVEERGRNCAVIISLKESDLFYSIESRLLKTVPFWPYVVFTFAWEIPEEN